MASAMVANSSEWLKGLVSNANMPAAAASRATASETSAVKPMMGVVRPKALI